MVEVLERANKQGQYQRQRDLWLEERPVERQEKRLRLAAGQRTEF